MALGFAIDLGIAAAKRVLKKPKSKARAKVGLAPSVPALPAFSPGAEVEIMAEDDLEGLPASTVIPAGGKTPSGYFVDKDGVLRRRKRRRRRRLLTAQDKADLAFLIGQLGKGATGSSAVSALLSRRIG